MAANGVNYVWDDNGNVISDGVYTYTYDTADRLIGMSGTGLAVNNEYNGLGDRLSETVNDQTTHYTMDLNAVLTQVLQDGTNTYLYGAGRIAQYGANGAEYFLGDALGSVRQLVNASGNITLAKDYKPYGEVLSSTGGGATSYGFTGEWTDGSTGDVYLRSRWYAPGQGRFLTKDTWQGDYQNPLTLNRWNYVEGNPINLADPSGHIEEGDEQRAKDAIDRLFNKYSVVIPIDFGFMNVQVPDRMLYATTKQLKYDCQKVWYGGAWKSLLELGWVETAIGEVAALMGGPAKFKSALRNKVTITRLGIPDTDYPVIGPIRAFAPPGGGSVVADSYLPDYSFT